MYRRTVGVWGSTFDSDRSEKRGEAKRKAKRKRNQAKRERSEALTKPARSAWADPWWFRGSHGSQGLPVRPPYRPGTFENQRFPMPTQDPRRTPPNPAGALGIPLETLKGYPGNPPGPLEAPQLSRQSLPGQLIDHVFGVGDRPTSNCVSLGA